MGDSDDEPNYKLFPLNPPKVQKEEPIPVAEPPKTEVVLKQYIIQLINDRHAKQMLIDKGEFVKKGPGRHRKWKFPTTDQVKVMTKSFFIRGLK